MLTVQQVAGVLQLSVPTIRRIIKRGDLPSFKAGQGVRVRRADLDAYMERIHRGG